MRLFDRTVLIILCMVLAVLGLLLWCICRNGEEKVENGSQDRKPLKVPDQSRSTQETISFSDRIIYSTMADARDNQIPAPRKDRKPLELDSLSITTNEIDILSQNREFRDNPIRVLERSGVTKAELRCLMSHPDFLDDPLAALRRPSAVSTNGSQSSIKFESPGRTVSSVTTTPNQTEPLLVN